MKSEPEKALALQYLYRNDTAPRIIAKGGGFQSRRIREYAEKYDVPIIKNDELVEGLWNTPITEYIPVEYYKAAAEIILFIYKLQGKL